MINGKKKQPKIFAFVLALALVFSSGISVMATEQTPAMEGIFTTFNAAPLTASFVQGYIRPDVTVKFNAETMAFIDTKGNEVYPVIYNGCTYLPVRAMSTLMQQDIEWRPTLSTIFIGKTLSNPMKLTHPDGTKYAVTVTGAAATADLKPALVTMTVRPQFKVYYDFEEMTFENSQGQQIYPIVCNGSTYLPVRAISKLLGQPVEWDSDLRVVYIGSKTPLTHDEIKVRQKPQSTKDIQELYRQVTQLYSDATSSISSLQSLKTAADFNKLSETISKDVDQAGALKIKVRSLKTEYEGKLTAEQLEAIDKLYYFSAINEAYIETMENIVYMFIGGENIIILQEAFQQFALDSMNACEAARLAQEAL